MSLIILIIIRTFGHQIIEIMRSKFELLVFNASH